MNSAVLSLGVCVCVCVLDVWLKFARWEFLLELGCTKTTKAAAASTGGTEVVLFLLKLLFPRGPPNFEVPITPSTHIELLQSRYLHAYIWMIHYIW